jgi:predicted dehydrogenase
MKHRVALIGCGRISFKHIEAYVKNSDRIELVAVCDPIESRMNKRSEEYKKHFPESEIKKYTDYKQMLSECKPEIVDIATESGKHCSITCDCLNAGCHVNCEKPMALSTDDAQLMIDTAEKNNKILAVDFQNRFNAPVVKLRKAIDEGRFGKILHGMVQIRWTRDEAYYKEAPWRGTWEQDGGTLMNQCTHGIDLLQWIMGEDAVRVQAVTRRFMRPIDAEDFGAALVEFKSGAVGIIEGTADVYPKNLNETLSVFGTQGTVVIGGLAVNKIETWRFSDAEKKGDTEEVVLNPDEKDPPTVYGFGHSAHIADVLDAIEQNRQPLNSGKNAKKALDIILAIYKSQKTGKPVELPDNFSTLEMKGVFSK